VVRSLAPHLVGRTIVSARFTSKHVTPGDRAELARQVTGRRIESIRRRGKFIDVTLDAGHLVMHLGMTGKLLTSGVEGKHTYGVFTLDDGVLLYDDPRQFGSIEWGDARVRRLGPEPLEILLEEFTAALRARKTRVKALLLNQSFLAGIGNIYADEMLFAAGIHPLVKAFKLSAARAGQLHRAMLETLSLAIEHRGSSISDYVDADGKRGDFQALHRVYGRDGQPCLTCGTAIKKAVVASRGTHYCPACQKR